LQASGGLKVFLQRNFGWLLRVTKKTVEAKYHRLRDDEEEEELEEAGEEDCWGGEGDVVHLAATGQQS
jgi:hypothetical protein